MIDNRLLLYINFVKLAETKKAENKKQKLHQKPEDFHLWYRFNLPQLKRNLICNTKIILYELSREFP